MALAVVRRDPLACFAAAAAGAVLGLLVALAPTVAVAVVLAGAAGAFVLARADLVLLAMIAALPWEAKLHYPSASLSTVKGIGAAVMIAYLIRVAANRRTRVHLPGLLAVVALLAVWITISTIASVDPSECLEKLVRWMLFFAFFFLVVQLVDTRREIRRAMRWFATSVTIAAVYALWGFLIGHNGSRVAGPLEDPNDFAYLLACSLPLVAYLITADRLRRWLWALAFVLIASAMLATFSRGALVGIGVLLLWGIFTRRVPLWAVASGLGAVAVVAALAFTVWHPLLEKALHQKSHIAQSNVESRDAFWAAAIKLAERRPLTGVGPGRFPKEALPLLRNNPEDLEKPVTHNSYLEILSENGVPALALFLAYLLGAWGLLARVQRIAREREDVDERMLATALQSALLIAVVSATFLSEELTAPFWLIGGLAVVLARVLARERSSAREYADTRSQPALALPASASA
jgi:putative inorganic carbon (hco3(-)) transporter